MQHLRRQVDRIDQKLLKLLQQRTKLSGEIGRAKRRHGAEIYVPDREREVFARVAQRAGKSLPGAAVTAIFREILSSSRAAQGQAPIGLLDASAEIILPSARAHFGACDKFASKRRWRDLVPELASGKLVVALLTLTDLSAIFASNNARATFIADMTIVGEFSGGCDLPDQEPVFIVKSRSKETRRAGNRALILIECKITANAVKSLLTAMPNRPTHAAYASLSPSSGRNDSRLGLLSLTFSRSVDEEVLGPLAGSGVKPSIVGIYPGGEVYGG